MKILDRYIFREVLVPALIALMALTFVLFSRQIGTLFETIVRQSATAAEIGRISLAILPNALTITIPMAVLVGILTGLGRMSSDSETVAFRAVGISMRQLLRPIIVLGLLAWSVTLILTVWIAPQATARLRDLQSQIAVKQVSLGLQPRVFNENLPNLVLYVQDISPNGLDWRGIMLSDMSDPNDPRVTFARSGRLVRDDEARTFLLTLTDGSTHIVSPLAPSRHSFSTFRTNTISIPMPQTPPQREPVPAEITTAKLRSMLASGTVAGDEGVEFHRRLALPFACLAFVLVAVPLGVSTTRGSKSMGLVLSLVLMLVYYLLFIGGTRIAADGQFSPWLGAWMANFVFVVLGVFLMIQSDRARESRIQNAIAGVTAFFSSNVLLGRTREQFGRWVYPLAHHPKFFRLLDIYVLRGFWFFLFLVLGVLAALFVVVTLFELLSDIVRHNVDTAVVVNYFVFLLPQILYWVLPLAVLLAILINLGTLTKTNQILAVKAGAVSLYRMAFPLLVMGLTLSAALYLLQDFLLPYTNQRQDELRNVIKGRAPQTYREPHRKWMAGSDDRVYHYSYFDADENLFGGVSIFEFQPNTFELSEWTFATRARWNGRFWTLQDGWIRRLSSNGEADYRSFQQLAFTQMDGPDYFKKEVRTASQMTYIELKQYVDDLRQSGFDATNLTVDLYRKLSFPLVTFIMSIIGIPFSFTTGKKGAFYGIGLCVAVGIFYWSTFELFDKLGTINRLSPLIAAWFPNLIFGLTGVWLMLRVKT